MKNKFSILVSIISILFFCNCKNEGKQSFFSGTINYRYSYNSDILDVDSLTKKRPAIGLFSYDATDYQSTFIGPDTVTCYYSGKINRCVSRTESDGDFVCEDYSVITDSVLSTRLYDSDEKVLGYSCKILELQKRNSRVKYYVSNDLKIAPATYQRHRSYNWDVYGEKANGGLILKLEHRFKDFIMSGLATGLKKYDTDFKAVEVDENKFAELCDLKK